MAKLSSTTRQPPKMSRKKKILFSLGSGLAAASIGLGALTKVHIETPRYLGLMKDPYAEKTLQSSVASVSNWKDAREYMIRHLRFEKTRNNMPETVHETKKAICHGATLIARRLLENNPNYKVTAVHFGTEKGKFFHSIALVKDLKTGKYGSLGIHASDCIEPKYDSPKQVYSRVNWARLNVFGKPKELD